MNTETIAFKDTPSYMLHRTDAPETSVQAAMKVSSGKMLELVYSEVVAAGEAGVTTKEIRSKYPFMPYSSITARPATLEELGKIYYRGDKRDKCRIMRAVIA